MSKNLVPYVSLSEDKQKEAIQLARRQQSLVIFFSNIKIHTKIPNYIEIPFKCTNCSFILDIYYQSKDWIKIDTDISFMCSQGNCKGKLVPEIW